MATHVHGHQFTIRVMQYRRVPLQGEGQGFTTEPAGEKEYRVHVAVDIAGLADSYGPRAVASKRGKATACGGLVVIRLMGGEGGD